MNALSLPASYANVYFLGPTAERVSFASQQRRALNLVWALNEKHDLAGRTVGIIGGGVAGLTAAAAAISCGADVTLFESEHEICAKQRDTDKRFIHPSINFWPNEPLESITSWPFLNWYAAPTRDVIKIIRGQWERYFAPAVGEKRPAKVHEVGVGPAGVRFDYGDKGVQWFDFAIAAVGFGPEQGLPFIPAESYWKDREFDRSEITKDRCVWISGTGDGALIDCLRVCYRDFDRGRILFHAALELQSLQSPIAEVETAGMAKSDLDARSLFLEEKYKDLAERPSVVNFLSKALATAQPTPLVTLVHRLASPFDYRTAPIHRIFLALAINKGLVKPVRGTVSSDKDGGIFECHGGDSERIMASQIVLRHGATGALKGLISDGAITELQSAVFRTHENGLHGEQWPFGYFEALKVSKFPTVKRKTAEMMSDATKILRGALQAHDVEANVSVGKSGDERELLVHTSTNYAHVLQFCPKKVIGITVKYLTDDEIAMLHGRSESSVPTYSVCPGALVAFGEQPAVARWFPVTCIGKDATTNTPVGLCITHQCDATEGQTVYVRLPRGEVPVGTVNRIMPFDGNLDPTTEPDIICVLFELDPDASFDVAPPGHQLLGILSDSLSLLDSSGQGIVYKWGVDASTHKGRVASVAGLVNIATNPKSTLFSDVITVEGEEEFSRPGDSGSLVVTEGGAAVGVVVAGRGKLTYLLPLGKLLDRCQLSLVFDGTDTSLLMDYGAVLLDQQRLDEAAYLYRRALDGLQAKSSGGLERATALHGLATVRLRQGKSAEAEDLYEEALNLRRTGFGGTHPKVAETIQGLARSMADQGKLAEAEVLSRNALNILEGIVGTDHADTSAALKNLAWVLRRLGRFGEATSALEHALEIREAIWGPSHLQTADLLLEFGWVAFDEGKVEEARTRFDRVLEIAQQLGSHKRLSAAALQGQAAVLGKQGRSAEAEKLLREALALRLECFGSHHPLVTTTMLSLAYACGDQGRLSEAEELFESVVEIRERTAGPEHPDMASALKGLGGMQRRRRQYEKAKISLERALAIRTATSGAIHKETSEVLLELGWLAFDQGKLDEAQMFFERVLGGAEQLNAVNVRAAALQGLGSVLGRQAEPALAEKLFLEALALRRESFGDCHPVIGTTLLSLAQVCGDQGRLVEAEELFRKAVDIRERTAGPLHPDTAHALKGLGWVLRRLQRFDEADELLQRVARINDRTADRSPEP